MKRALCLLVVLTACSSTPLPVIVSFTSSAASIDQGGSTFLRYQVTGADSLSIDPGIGNVTGTNASVAAPVQTTVYTLTARNDGGATTATTRVVVVPLPATLTSFAATPDSIVSGAAVTLKWASSNVASIALSAQPPGETLPSIAPTATQAVVHPTASTVYTLTVLGNGTKQPAPMSAIVVVGGVPVVALSAAQTSVPRGSAVALSWTSSINANFTLVATPHGGTAVRTPLGTVRQTQVRPLVDTDYAIEAVAAGGKATSNTVVLTMTGAPASSFAYLPPSPGTGDVIALQGSVAGDVVTLDLITTQAIAASALALELPLDGDTAGSRDGSVRAVLDASAPGDLSPGFTVDGALDPGRSPAAAIASLQASGPSAGMLMLAIAQKPTCAACNGGVGTDATLPSGTRVGSVRLKLVPSAGAGPIFSSGALDAVHGFRSVVKNAAGSVVGTVSVGSLSAL
jgi:hypothetical protein